VSIQITRWSPDTCGCVLEYEWDDAVAPDSRVHSHNRTVNKCQHHADIGDSAAYDAVVDENSRKNISLGILAKTLPRVKGPQNEDLDPTAIYLWTFLDDRTLRVSIDGVGGRVSNLTPAERSAWQGALNARFGPGKVVVV